MSGRGPIRIDAELAAAPSAALKVALFRLKFAADLEPALLFWELKNCHQTGASLTGRSVSTLGGQTERPSETHLSLLALLLLPKRAPP